MRAIKVAVSVSVVVLLAGLTGYVNSKPVAAMNPQPVIVTNTPLPTTATQSGTWTVGISGAPSVTVANSALATKDQYSLALAEPVSFTDTFTMGPNIFGGESASYNVPANKRLVVQYVSMSCTLPGSGNAEGHIISDQGHPGSTSFMGVFVAMQSVPYSAGCADCARSTGGTPATVLFDGGSSLQVEVERTNGVGTGFCFGGFTGYLIDVP